MKMNMNMIKIIRRPCFPTGERGAHGASRGCVGPCVAAPWGGSGSVVAYVWQRQKQRSALAGYFFGTVSLESWCCFGLLACACITPFWGCSGGLVRLLLLHQL